MRRAGFLLSRLLTGARAAGFFRRCKPAWADQRGAAAIEFALFGMLLSVAILNVTDISVYIYQRLQVENATQMGVQAAWKTCDLLHLPATKNCPNLTTAIQTAIASTSLGNKVSLKSSPSEGYYCINSSNELQYMSNMNSRPADCTAAGTPSLQPANYITVETTFSYSPIFPGVTVSSYFTTPIVSKATMRLG